MIAKASKNSFLDYKSGGVKIGQISHESWSVGRHCRAGSIFAMEIRIVRDKRDRSPIGSRSSYWRNSPLNPMLSAICFTSSSAPLEGHSGYGIHSLVILRFIYARSHDLPSKTMKRPNSTSLRRHAGAMKAGNLEKELKEIRQGLAWMRTEQKEMKRWIRDALRNPGSLSRS